MTTQGLPQLHGGTLQCLSRLHHARLSWRRGLRVRPIERSWNSSHSRESSVQVVVAGRKNVSKRISQLSKSRVVEAPKKLGAVGGPPVKPSQLLQGNTSGADIRLTQEQALGQVITAQANFMRVLVQRAGNSQGLPVEPIESNTPGAGNSGEEVANDGIGHLEANNGHMPEDASAISAMSGNIPNIKEVELLCVVRNVLKKIGRRVLVGDRVLVTGIDWTEKRGMIEDVIDRTSEVLDPPLANVNQLLLVFSLDQPQIDEKVLSRFLVDVESTELPFSLVLNKVDLARPEAVRYWQARLAHWGYDPILCSADSRLGLSEVTGLLKSKITVIIGPSGVGKSSLINALRDKEGLTLWNEAETQHSERDVAEPSRDQGFQAAFEQLRVGEVSVGSGRGRHTTRHVSLLRVPGGSGRLADTPGFSRPSLAKVTATSLQDLFPEVERRINQSDNGRCGFPNCLHVGEPHCVVGEDWDRYPQYVALLEELRNREQVEKRVLGTKRESEVRYKVATDGVKQAEPRLTLKKHRRESRKHFKQTIEDEFQDEEKLQADINDDALRNL